MGKNIVEMREAYWVWLGENSAIRVASEDAVLSMYLECGQEFNVANSFGRCDQACKVLEIVWDEPLLEGKTCHKTIFSPVDIIKFNGEIRKVIRYQYPSRLVGLRKSWAKHGENWWPNEYDQAIVNPDVCVLRGRKSEIEQLAVKFSPETGIASL